MKDVISQLSMLFGGKLRAIKVNSKRAAYSDHFSI